MAKSNIDHIRDLLNETTFENPSSTELFEFLDAAEEEISDLEQENKELRKENSEQESEIDDLKEKIEELEEQELGDEVYLGLDTLRYELKNGNLKVQIQLEHWIGQVQKQNGVVPTPRNAKISEK